LNEKPFSPACERNRQPILAVIQPLLAARGVRRVLEIGSGTGQHAVYFARAMPDLTWVTSDRTANHGGIRAWVEEAAINNVEGPLTLDVLDGFPDIDPLPQAVFSANTAHIMSWQGVQAMFAGIGDLLEVGGLFLLYGPFNRNGEYTGEGNRVFDASLRARDAQMGIRDLEALQRVGAEHALRCRHVHPMPADNFLLEWERV
jgi:SAM-dependent methyltransferase